MIIVTDSGLIVQQEDDSALLFLKEAVECACGRMAMITVNRWGRTRCSECDTEALKQGVQNV